MRFETWKEMMDQKDQYYCRQDIWNAAVDATIEALLEAGYKHLEDVLSELKS